MSLIDSGPNDDERKRNSLSVQNDDVTTVADDDTIHASAHNLPDDITSHPDDAKIVADDDFSQPRAPASMMTTSSSLMTSPGSLMT